jgi:hypothetical protein
VWILAPDVALSLSTTKDFNPGKTSDATSKHGLLDASGVSDGTMLAGVPVLVSTDVGAGNAWGLESSQVIVVQRAGTTFTRSGDSAFDYDADQQGYRPRLVRGFLLPGIEAQSPALVCIGTLCFSPEAPRRGPTTRSRRASGRI